MRLGLATLLLATTSLVPMASASTVYYEHPRHHTVYRGRHHIRKTVKRVGVGAAGGAAIGAVAGGGAGAIYDHHEKTKGR
jgi:hypothetical protein